MVTSAQHRHDSRRIFVAAWLLAGLVFTGAALTADKADASCGDYLLHGPTDNSLATDANSLLDHLPISGSPVPAPPTSPCANGRCQSAPVQPPANSPTRAVYVKQPVVLDSIGSLEREKDALSWLFPADGLRPEAPSIAVDLPPPKRAC